MKIAAVTYINFFDNEMFQKIVHVDDESTWKDAFIKAIEDGLIPSFDGEWIEWITSMSDDLTEARHEMWDGEIDVIVTFGEC